MKKITLLLLLLTGVFAFGQRTCHTSQKMAELIMNNPEFATHHQETMDYIQNPNQSKTASNKTTSVVYTIPVVVHVLYKNSTQNISDAQVLSQIAILNNDFRKLNSDFSSVVPAAFQGSAADMEINFCMATRTPSGATTTGIERKSIAAGAIFEDIYYQSTGLVAWDPTKYLNIWVGRFTDTSLLGFAYLPSAAGYAFDGLCIGDQYYGNTGTATAPYNKGRTATHEIGHYFGLLHPWGEDGSACGSAANSDGVSDTPSTNNPYYSCPSYPSNTRACTITSTGSMFMNYMDYVNDACMAFFTNGQKSILTNTINGPRASLKTSNGCQSLSVTENEAIQAIAVYPNPVSQFFMITSPQINVDFVEIFSTNGQLVKSQKLDEVNNKIYVDNLETGVYYLRIYNENRLLKSDKLIKK